MTNFQKLKGKRFVEMFRQAQEWLIINFGEEVEYSIHAACFVRISRGGELLFTSSDEFFNSDRTQKCDGDTGGNLLDDNITIVNRLLKGALVKEVRCSQLGDVQIVFDNHCKIEICVDCIYEGYEYYRLIEYFPHFVENNSLSSKHHALVYQNGRIHKIEE